MMTLIPLASALGTIGAAFGAAIAALAAAIGIGKIGKSTMIIAAGMIEGASLFAIIVCLLAIFM